MPKYQIEWGKLALIGLLMTFGFVLIVVVLIVDVPDDRFAAVLAFATGCVTGPAGYLYGNGRLASRGEQPIPAIAVYPDRLLGGQVAQRMEAQGYSSELSRAVADRVAGHGAG